MTQRLNSVEVGNHIIAVYPDKQSKFDEAFEFLKPGLERNEVIMIITEDMTKEEIRARMQQEWQINVPAFESRGDIIIKTNSEWYFPDGTPNKYRTFALWKVLTEQSMARGKRGIRVFGDTAAFFWRDYGRELLDYETVLEKQFNFPLTAICAYEEKNVSKHYTKEEFRRLAGHHDPAWLPGG